MLDRRDNDELIQSLIKLGLWEHAAIRLGEQEIQIRRRDSNIHDVVVQVFWRGEVGMVYGFYVNI